MATRDEYLAQPVTQRLVRLARAADDLAAAIRGCDDTALSRRPAAGAWAAKEIVCHLRDIEELCMLRYHAMLSMDEPRMFVVGVAAADPAAWGIVGGAPYPIEAERWAAERQYLKNDTGEALAAFRRRRDEALGLLRALTPAQWERGGLVPTGARASFGQLVAASAAHDDAHLDQLTRALAGRA
jgi:hypothetical protein